MGDPILVAGVNPNVQVIQKTTPPLADGSGGNNGGNGGSGGSGGSGSSGGLAFTDYILVTNDAQCATGMAVSWECGPDEYATTGNMVAVVSDNTLNPWFATWKPIDQVTVTDWVYTCPFAQSDPDTYWGSCYYDAWYWQQGTGGGTPPEPEPEPVVVVINLLSSSTLYQICVNYVCTDRPGATQAEVEAEVIQLQEAVITDTVEYIYTYSELHRAETQ